MDRIAEFGLRIFEYGVVVFAFLLLVVVIWLACMYVVDVMQTEQTIRRNYPILGRLRYKFEHLGEFFRQYFFALDREELPFNRAQRSWVYRAAKNIDSTVAFGSTRPLNQPGDIIFMNCPFPTLSEDSVKPSEVVIGEGYAAKPYSTDSIVNISGMSYGALSAPAVRALSIGAAKAGIWMNTGEGGLSKYHLEGGCDLIFQIGTAKYGVRDSEGNLSEDKLREIADHENVRMFEIKMSQGAKPGKGGMLPGAKVSEEIAGIRGIPVGQDSISPNGHKDIENVDELMDMIYRIRQITGKPVGFKSVIGLDKWLTELFEKTHERGMEYAPDFITIDSADGGTGAAPQSLMDYMGLPLKRSLPLVSNLMIEQGVKGRIKLICSGKLINPSEAAWAFSMGADFVTSARGFLFSLGCIQALQCNKNTCPTGITTHDKKLQRGLVASEKSVRVMHYAENMRKEIGIIAHSCGVKEPRQLKRYHAQLINDRGVPEPLDEIYPVPEVRTLKIKS